MLASKPWLSLSKWTKPSPTHHPIEKDNIRSISDTASDIAPDTPPQSSTVQHEVDNVNPQLSKDDEAILERKQLYVVSVALILTTFVISLDISVVATATPRITDHFHTLADLGWYGAAYLLANSAFQPLTGKIYTHFPLKWAFLTFLAVFEVGNMLAGAASSSKMLVVGRAVSGLGSSGLMNGALTIIGVAAPKNKRPIVLGVVMGFFGTGTLVGPLLGGAMTQHLSWRWCFYINLPIGAATAICMFFVRIVNPARKPVQWTPKALLKNFDIVGFVLFAPACIMLLLAMEWGGINYAWSSPMILGLILGSLATFLIFGIWESRQGESAMIPTSLIRQQIVYSACLTSALQGGSLIMLGYYLPLYFQIVRQASPQSSAIRILPSVISQILVAILSGALMPKVGYLMPFALFGAGCTTIGSGLITTFTPTTSEGKWIGYQIFIGGGRGLAMQIPVQIIQANLAPQLMPVGTAIVSWSQFFGGSIFLGIGQTAFQNLLRHALVRYAPKVDAAQVLGAGATGYQAVVPPALWDGVEMAYNEAITRTYYITVGAAAASFLTSMGMGWRSSVKDKKTVADPEVVKAEAVVAEKSME